MQTKQTVFSLLELLVQLPPHPSGESNMLSFNVSQAGVKPLEASKFATESDSELIQIWMLTKKFNLCHNIPQENCSTFWSEPIPISEVLCKSDCQEIEEKLKGYSDIPFKMFHGLDRVMTGRL